LCSQSNCETTTEALHKAPTNLATPLTSYVGGSALRMPQDAAQHSADIHDHWGYNRCYVNHIEMQVLTHIKNAGQTQYEFALHL